MFQVLCLGIWAYLFFNGLDKALHPTPIDLLEIGERIEIKGEVKLPADMDFKVICEEGIMLIERTR